MLTPSGSSLKLIIYWEGGRECKWGREGGREGGMGAEDEKRGYMGEIEGG